jgi:dTMP kinase
MSCFITLEGVEGAGKTTLQNRLAGLIKDRGYEVVITREPGATEIGKAIRELLLDPRNSSLSPTAELMLFAADRAQHVTEIIKPALDRGAVVICDRYIHSTLAYQGYGRGLNIDLLHQLNQQATNGVTPDLVLLLDLDPKIGLSRASKRVDACNGQDSDPNSGWTRFEAQELEFHQRIRNGFLELANQPNSNFHVVDADQDADSLFNCSVDRVIEALER